MTDIDWTHEIDTVHGEPAKLVYTGPGVRLVVLHPGTQSIWTNEEGNGIIRNVPEPPVKLDGWIGISEAMDYVCIRGQRAHLSNNAWTYILNLALVSEKCPEAIEKVGK